MATIKSHTDINQSKKLAEILPLESADLYYMDGTKYVMVIPHYETDFFNLKKDDVPCWSLAALLSVLPVLKRIGYEKAKPNIHFNVFIEKWICNSLYYTSDSYDNPVDACYEMILKLHERKML